tara:strand:+ start:28259 stop:29266 length:1008 start_codon:yes stop_codon:yes gene_type:complete
LPHGEHRYFQDLASAVRITGDFRMLWNRDFNDLSLQACKGKVIEYGLSDAMSVVEHQMAMQSDLGFDFSRVAFQPIFETDGRLHGVEALMRFVGNAVQGSRNQQNSMERAVPRNHVSPETIFFRARESNWIMELDFYCREQILQQSASAQWKNRLFINVCPESLLSPHHSVGRTDGLVDAAGLRKEQIVLEITEETAIQNYELFARTISHYREQGYKIAIDDFGSGYAGLKMLASVQPDYLKIDRYFIQRIHREPVKYVIVESLVNICNKLGIKLIAEGIETGLEFHSILNLGIQYRQGFYFAEPSFELKSLEMDSCFQEESVAEISQNGSLYHF